MSGRYLTDLETVVRAAGLVTRCETGWESRARSSGGYATGRPTHVMCHHTASGPSSDGQPDVDYIAYRDDDAPLANLYLSRAGQVWVIAAGCTNTNGSGADWWGGGVPVDSMNSYAIGVEAGNDGVGEIWPMAQQESYLILVGALCDAYGIPVHHVRAHHEWTDRKIDPAGPSQWAAAGSWDMDAFRADIGGDLVTDHDVQRIADAVWARMLTLPQNMDPAPAQVVVADTLVGLQNMGAQVTAIQHKVGA